MQKISINSEIYLKPFSVNEHWPLYMALLEHNKELLHKVEMNQIVYYENNVLLEKIEQGLQDHSPCYAIFSNHQFIGRIWTLKTEYDDINYDAIGIILDHAYVAKHNMSQILPVFFNLCKSLYHITTILWEAKSINAISNHLAEKYGFKLYKKLKINPKTLHPNWTCEHYMLYLKQL